MLLDGIGMFLPLGMCQTLLRICGRQVVKREMVRVGARSLLSPGNQPKEESTGKQRRAAVLALFFQQLKYPLCKEKKVTPPYIPFLKFSSKSSHHKREGDRIQGGKQTLTKWHFLMFRYKTRTRQNSVCSRAGMSSPLPSCSRSQEPSTFLLSSLFLPLKRTMWFINLNCSWYHRNRMC